MNTDEARREAAAAIALLPPIDYPNMTATATELTLAMAGTEPFSYGLERILDGLAARTTRRHLRCGWG